MFNKRTLVVEESIHVVFDESNDPPSRKNEGVDDADPLIEGMKEITLKDSATPEDKDKKTNKMREVKKLKNNLKVQMTYPRNGGMFTTTLRS